MFCVLSRRMSEESGRDGGLFIGAFSPGWCYQPGLKKHTDRVFLSTVCEPLIRVRPHHFSRSEPAFDPSSGKTSLMICNRLERSQIIRDVLPPKDASPSDSGWIK